MRWHNYDKVSLNDISHDMTKYLLLWFCPVELRAADVTATNGWSCVSGCCRSLPMVWFDFAKGSPQVCLSERNGKLVFELFARLRNSDRRFLHLRSCLKLCPPPEHDQVRFNSQSHFIIMTINRKASCISADLFGGCRYYLSPSTTLSSMNFVVTLFDGIQVAGGKMNYTFRWIAPARVFQHLNCRKYNYI